MCRPITEMDIEDNLMTTKVNCPPPDILIRTSGVKRMSDFLLWQASPLFLTTEPLRCSSHLTVHRYHPDSFHWYSLAGHRPLWSSPYNVRLPAKDLVPVNAFYGLLLIGFCWASETKLWYTWLHYSMRERRCLFTPASALYLLELECDYSTVIPQNFPPAHLGPADDYAPCFQICAMTC